MGLWKKLIDKFCAWLTVHDGERIASQNPPENVETVLDVNYADADELYNKLDVYYPTGSENELLPTIIDVHGGCWFYGTKDINKYYGMEIAAKGFKVVSISYRLLFKGGRFPNNLNDLFSAYKWVEEHADEYKFDLNRLFLTGDSAGAHLCAMSNAVIADEELQNKLQMKTCLNFKAVGYTCGVFDVDFYKRKINISPVRFLLKEFFGKGYKKNEFLPLATIKNAKLEKFPPIFLATGKGDFMRGQVIGFDKELTKRGIEHELNDLVGTSHKLEHVYPIIQPHWEESEFVTNNMLEFFRTYAE